MSRQKTECAKSPIPSKRFAEEIAKSLSEKYGRRFRVYPCAFHKAWHTTKRIGSESSKGNPETIRFNKLKNLRRKRLPLETWENEGGAIHPNGD